MPVMNTLGRFSGQAAAYVVQGTALGATSFAQGAKEGYVTTAAELRAKREALAIGAPAVTRQKRLAVAKA